MLLCGDLLLSRDGDLLSSRDGDKESVLAGLASIGGVLHSRGGVLHSRDSRDVCARGSWRDDLPSCGDDNAWRDEEG